MAIRTKLLSGRNINTDSDFSKYIETVSEPGVIEGMVVSSGKVGVGKCWVPCERTNGETIYSLVENFTEITIDTSGTGFVIVSIPQNMIDDGSIINEDGTNVASVEVVAELPEKNYLKLASINAGVITDERNMIKKVGELNTAIESLFSRVENIDERVETLEEAGAIDNLKESLVVGEKYTSIGGEFYVAKIPNVNNCNASQSFGHSDSRQECHIQRISNGKPFDKISFKVTKYGSPTTNLRVEVREGKLYNYDNPAKRGWYGDSTKILASGVIPYTSVPSGEVVELDLDSTVSCDKGTLLSIVFYQETGGEKIINSWNHYQLYYDKTQFSEAFRTAAKANGGGISFWNGCIHCDSVGFMTELLGKVDGTNSGISGSVIYLSEPDEKRVGVNTTSSSGTRRTLIGTYKGPVGYSSTLSFQGKSGGTTSSSYTYIQYSIGDSTSYTTIVSNSETSYVSKTISLSSGQTIKLWSVGDQSDYSTTHYNYVKNLSITYSSTIQRQIDLKGKVDLIKNIGERIDLNILGNNNGKFYGGTLSETLTNQLRENMFGFGNIVSFLESKGTAHISGASTTSKVMTGYGYIIADADFTGGLIINGKTMYGVGFMPLCPGDTITTTGTYSGTIYDYY